MVNLFVYGTLMSGERANGMLKGCKSKGLFILENHAMYNLGSYPGIIEMKGENVIGEVYEIPNELLAMLDRYESEGDLYVRKIVWVQRAQEHEMVAVYVYNHDVEGRLMRDVWNAKDNEYVWYACYGSNLSEERFRCYIEGGVNPYNGKHYSGCADKSLWIGDTTKGFCGRVYFGGKSSSWENKGVAFYDPNEINDYCLMRLYKITREQFYDVQKQEGKSAEWYGRIIQLGVMEDGCPILTMTCETPKQINKPCDAYFNLIKNALYKLGSKTDADWYMQMLTNFEPRKWDLNHKITKEWLDEYIDPEMQYAIKMLNEKGYETVSCCQGHYYDVSDMYGSAYLSLKGVLPNELFPNLKGFPWKEDGKAPCRYKTPFTYAIVKKNSLREMIVFYWTGSQKKTVTKADKDREHKCLFEELNKWVDELPERR